MGPGGIGCCTALAFTEFMDGSGVDESEEEAEIVLLASPVMINEDGGEFARTLLFGSTGGEGGTGCGGCATFFGTLGGVGAGG